MSAENEHATLHAEEPQSGVLRLTVSGRLDADSTGGVWRKAMDLLAKSSPALAIVESSELEYCDISGIGLFLGIRRYQMRRNQGFEVRGLRREFRQLLDLFDPEKLELHRPGTRESLPAQMGRFAHTAWRDLRSLITFLGALCVALAKAARNPAGLRWQDVLLTAEKAGADALPIVALVSFLVGVIMAFQSAIPMRQFGAEIYVANLVALSMLRELGPLMMALVLAGRTGSAFAAELGTMKVNEEIDALVTMGLEPVGFLVTTRVIAGIFVAPLLAVFADLLGVVGGGVVMVSLGFSVQTYYNQMLVAVNYVTFLGGIAKCFAFGLIVAGIGCARGLETRIGAAAVGESATRSVVSGIVLIIAADGIFSVVYYFLGI